MAESARDDFPDYQFYVPESPAVHQDEPAEEASEPIVEITEVRPPVEPEPQLLADALTSIGDRAAWTVVRAMAEFVAPGTGLLVDIVHVTVRISSASGALDLEQAMPLATPQTPPGFDLRVGLSTRLGEVAGASVPLHLAVSPAANGQPFGTPEAEAVVDHPFQLRLDQVVSEDHPTVLMTYPHGFGEHLDRAPWPDLVAHAQEVAEGPVADVVIVDAAHQQARWVRMAADRPEYDLFIEFSLDLERSAPVVPAVTPALPVESEPANEPVPGVTPVPPVESEPANEPVPDVEPAPTVEPEPAVESVPAVEPVPMPVPVPSAERPFFASSVVRRADGKEPLTLAIFWFPADPQPPGDLVDCMLELGTATAAGAELVVGVDPQFAGGPRIRERLAAQGPHAVHASLAETLDAASRRFAELLDPAKGWLR